MLLIFLAFSPLAWQIALAMISNSDADRMIICLKYQNKHHHESLETYRLRFDKIHGTNSPWFHQTLRLMSNNNSNAECIPGGPLYCLLKC